MISVVKSLAVLGAALPSASAFTVSTIQLKIKVGNLQHAALSNSLLLPLPSLKHLFRFSTLVEIRQSVSRANGASSTSLNVYGTPREVQVRTIVLGNQLRAYRIFENG